MVHSATFVPTPAAPSAIATLFGSNLGPANGVQFRLDADGLVPSELAEIRVLVGGLPAPILYAQDRQINFIVPGRLTGNSTDVCVVKGAQQTCLPAAVAPYAPGIFRVGSGSAVRNQDASLNTPENPAPRGSIISVYGTGLGPYTRAVPDGSVAELPINYLTYPVRALFDNPFPLQCGFGGAFCLPHPGPFPGDVLFAGAAPGIVNGVTVLNVRIPVEAIAGSAVPLELLINTGTLPDTLTKAVAVVAIK